MPRKGWSALETPRPPSVRWPNAKSSTPGTKPQSIPPRGRWHQERPRATPEEAWESAKKRVCVLEVAISAMIVNGFDETSSEAKRNAQQPSLSIQLKGAMEFVDRARKRLAAHDAQRAQRLEAEVSVAPSTRPAELDAEVSQLKAKVAMMEAQQAHLREGVVREPNAERMSDAPSIAGIPPMPHHAQEVEQWLIDRNCELRSALHWQDTHMIAHIGALIAKGAVVHCRTNRRTVAVVSHGRPCHRGGREEEVHRSQSVPFHGGKPCVVRSSRYGLRGVRIGEASHPGPRLLRRYRGSRGGVAASSDDDAPLLSQDLRNVIPRMEGSVSVSDIDVAPGLESTTQVNSAEGLGRVSGELLDALERDLNVVAPKRRVRRVFNDNVESVQQDEDRVVQPVDVPRGRRVVLIPHSLVCAQHV